MHQLAENHVPEIFCFCSQNRSSQTTKSFKPLQPPNEITNLERSTSTFICSHNSTIAEPTIPTLFKIMMFKMTKSMLLAMLAAAAGTSSVSAEPATRIVGGSQANPGEYPYFGKNYHAVSL